MGMLDDIRPRCVVGVLLPFGRLMVYWHSWDIPLSTALEIRRMGATTVATFSSMRIEVDQ